MVNLTSFTNATPTTDIVTMTSPLPTDTITQGESASFPVCGIVLVIVGVALVLVLVLLVAFVVLRLMHWHRFKQGVSWQGAWL